MPETNREYHLALNSVYPYTSESTERDGTGTARTSQIKLRPGETIEEAKERISKEKEIRRIEKLLLLSYPR